MEWRLTESLRFEKMLSTPKLQSGHAARRRAPALVATILMLLVLSGCEGSPTPVNHPKTSATLSTINQSKVLSTSNIYSFTHQKPNGNRLLEGQGDFPNARSIDIELAGTP